MFNTDLLDKSVTKGDAQDYKGGPVMYMSFPQLAWQYTGSLPPEPPAYWTPGRDWVMRSTVQNESMWGSAIAKAASKVAAKSWDVEGNVKAKVERAQEMMLALDYNGWVPGTYKGVRDYLTTDNGEHWEIVRVSNAAGSRILGLVHLDSLRVTRTGDPDIPVLYRDLKGGYHELRDYQVISMCDMPSPGAEFYGVGYCAASRSYKHIYKLATMEQFVVDKISGNKPQEIHLVNGISPKSLDAALVTADERSNQTGAVIRKGVVVVPMMGDKPVSGYRVPIAEVPSGFDAKQERDYGVLVYANNIGLDPQELMPLSGQGLNGGTQSLVLMEAAKGNGLAARDKDWVHQINEKVNPSAVTFVFRERDLNDEKKEADNAKMRAETRKTQIDSGEITTLESRQLAVDSDDLPPEFIQDDETAQEQLGDEEKDTPEVDGPDIVPDPDAANPPTQAPVPPVNEPPASVRQKALDAGLALYQRMQKELG